MKNLVALAFIPETSIIEEFNFVKEKAPEIPDGM
jgi:hypothetical protein